MPIRLLVVSLSFAAAVHAAPSFTITTLSFGWDNSFASGINAQGHVVGSRQEVNGISPTTPFLYADGVLTDLSPASNFDNAEAINDNGTIVGNIGGEASIYAGSGVWDPLAVTGPVGDVFALNNAGVAAGSVWVDAFGVRHAVRYAGGVATDLGTLVGEEGYSVASAINSAGDIVGNSDIDIDTYHAVRFDSGGGITDLGTLDGVDGNSDAFDINDNGQIVGWSTANDGLAYAFLWDSGSMVSLGVGTGFEYSMAYGLNNHGHAVGFMATLCGCHNTAFFYDGTTLWDLADLVQGGLAAAGIDYFFDAVDINDNGQIVGNAFDLDGNRVAYVLTPTAVPEPGAWGAAFAALLLAIVLVRRRSRVA